MEEFAQQAQVQEPETSGAAPEKTWEPEFRLYEGPELRQLKSDNQRLQQQIHALGQQAQARFQSLGSMRSAGRAPQTDDFLMGFDQA